MDAILFWVILLGIACWAIASCRKRRRRPEPTPDEDCQYIIDDLDDL